MLNNYYFDRFVAKPSSFLKRHGNIYISDEQLDILKKYDINIEKYNNVSELMYEIESYLNSGEAFEDLEWVSQTLAEYNYYNNVNK